MGANPPSASSWSTRTASPRSKIRSGPECRSRSRASRSSHAEALAAARGDSTRPGASWHAELRIVSPNWLPGKVFAILEGLTGRVALLGRIALIAALAAAPAFAQTKGEIDWNRRVLVGHGQGAPDLNAPSVAVGRAIRVPAGAAPLGGAGAAGGGQPTMQPAQTQGDLLVQVAQGEAAVLDNDRPAARQKAIDDALRRAVEMAAGTRVSATTETKDFQLKMDQVLTHAQGFVRRYEIVSEGMDGNVVP